MKQKKEIFHVFFVVGELKEQRTKHLNTYNN